jgi:hypothetical protein
MSLTKRLCLFAGAAMSLSAAASAQSTVDQSRAYSAELAADANGRVSSLAQKSTDFTVAVHGYEQFRYNWNHRDDSGLDGNDNKDTIGFQNARTRINLSGNIGSENWGYFVQFGFGDPESGAFLEDAYGTYKMEGGWSLKFGQFKLPGTREELVGDTYQLLIDRSVSNTFFTLGRAQGVMVSYEADTFRFFGAVSDGAQTQNTDFTSGQEADYALTARGEFKCAGNWKQFNDFTSFQNSDFAGMVGGAVHWQDGGSTVNTLDVRNWDLIGDVSLEGNGWNAMFSLIYADSKPASGSDFGDWSFVIQGGIFLAPQWELVGRWDYMKPDGDRPDHHNFSTIGIGVNHYIIPESHAAKLSFDFSWFLQKQSDCDTAIPNTLTGLLSSSSDPQWNLRGQIQLMF